MVAPLEIVCGNLKIGLPDMAKLVIQQLLKYVKQIIAPSLKNRFDNTEVYQGCY